MKVTTELLSNLGNFINRALKFCASNYGGVVPEMRLEDADYELFAEINTELAGSHALIVRKTALRKAYR